MNIKRLQHALVLGLAISFCATPNFANNGANSREQAIQIATERSGGGKVLSVKNISDKNGNSIFAVKILKDGRVKVFRINNLSK